ncbi:MAG TPA: hypothetical protein VMF66_09250 [Candidatus Acidoferrum sp.]|nr:hypothetical protein [Candidatus Acidoferrum sp.]
MDKSVETAHEAAQKLLEAIEKMSAEDKAFLREKLEEMLEQKAEKSQS